MAQNPRADLSCPATACPSSPSSSRAVSSAAGASLSPSPRRQTYTVPIPPPPTTRLPDANPREPPSRSLTLYYQNEIRRTTDSLSSDLRHLSDQLVRAVPVAQPSVAPPVAQGPVIPQRLPFTEELKARVRSPSPSLPSSALVLAELTLPLRRQWNEQLGNLIHGAQVTDWSAVARNAYSSLRSTLAGAADAAKDAAPATAGAGLGAGAGAGVGPSLSGGQPGPSTPETRFGAGLPAEKEVKGPRSEATVDKVVEGKPLAVKEGKRWV